MFPAATQKLFRYVICTFLVTGLMLAFAMQAVAAEINPSLRTVSANPSGDALTLSEQQLITGQRKFNGSCAQCHLDGVTKTNPTVDLSSQTLSLATPPRDHIEGIVDYLKAPTTYDGAESLEELHPSTARSDLFPKMRDLTDEDLVAIAGYILSQPQIIGDQWAGGKPRR